MNNRPYLWLRQLRKIHPKPRLHEIFLKKFRTFILFSRGYYFHLCCFGNSFKIEFASLRFDSEAWGWKTQILNSSQKVDQNTCITIILVLSRYPRFVASVLSSRALWPQLPELIPVSVESPGWHARRTSQVAQAIRWYPFVLLGGERHYESKVSCKRTQHNDPGQGSNPDRSIRGHRVSHRVTIVMWVIVTLTEQRKSH